MFNLIVIHLYDTLCCNTYNIISFYNKIFNDHNYLLSERHKWLKL